MRQLFRLTLRFLLRLLYRVEVKGLEHYPADAKRLVVVANHTSFLDGLLLGAFLPCRLMFAIHTIYANKPWVQPIRGLVDLFPMEPTSPLAMKGLIHQVQKGCHAAIFPEGRITVTGALMKVYDGPALIADKAQAPILPVRIEGAQYTPFSRLAGRFRLRWFPKITLTILPPRTLDLPDDLHGRERRRHAGVQLHDLLTHMMFETSGYRSTLFQALLEARRVHGGGRRIAEDIQRQPVTYSQLVMRALILGRALEKLSEPKERVGVLLPSTVPTLLVLFGLNAVGRVAAMLNFTVGAAGMRSACSTATIRKVVSSRRFVDQAGLTAAVAELEQQVEMVYLEDLRKGLGPLDKLRGLLLAPVAQLWYDLARADRNPDDPAVVLFTSGSEGTPKGVVLSNANLLANRAQLATKFDFSPQDMLLSALPLFHSFGLTGGTILPITSGVPVFFYPSPLHYRIVPEVAYDINATILFGTNTFLAGYAQHAHPYDFYRMRYVFAGAEKLQDGTRELWQSKFGLRVLEGYGATETAPVLAANTPMEYRRGSVGRLLPGMEGRLEPVPGISEGGRLQVRGANVMLGYLLAANPGMLVPPEGGWYDTGDIVSIDEEGFIRILGRAKRFAKVGGEMVSLGAVEEFAGRVWPEFQHAVVTQPDEKKGEQLVLVTTRPDPDRAELLARAKAEGFGEINLPRRLIAVKEVPLLGTGKIDYPTVQRLVAE